MPPPPPPPPQLAPLPVYYASFKFTAANLNALGFPSKKKEWKKEEWKKYRTVKGWKEGVLHPPPLSSFKDAGVKPGVFSDKPTPLEVFNYYMEPIKADMLTNIMNEYKTNPEKYSSYCTSPVLKEEKLKKDIDRYFAANIEIRRQQRRSVDMNKWWGPLDKDGNKFIQQCLSSNLSNMQVWEINQLMILNKLWT